MKKKLLMITMLALALSATACSKKVDETTAAPETTTEAPATEAATEESSEEEDVEEDYMSGILTKFTDTILTIKNDDDGAEKDYDISNAEVIHDFPLSVGDWVEVSFPAESTEDPVPAIQVSVMESVIESTTDPTVEGTVADATMNTLTLTTDDGDSYTFTTSNAYVVGQEGILVDQKATVTYIGDVEDTDPNPLAVKIVMEDSYNTPEADLNAFSGEVAQIEGDSIVLKSADGDFYTFVSEDLDFSSCKLGDTIQIFYTGMVTEKAIPATQIVK